MNLLIILILYEAIDDYGESANFNRVLLTEKVSLKNLLITLIIIKYLRYMN